MRGITLNEDFIKDCLNAPKGAKVASVSEAKATEKKEEAVVEESEEKEEHVCPLCESKLEAPIPQEKLEEHVNYFLGIINENFEIEGESLDEEVEADEEGSEEDESK